MSQENYSVLVDAKQEYNHQIVNILSSGILKGIKGIYYECVPTRKYPRECINGFSR